MKSRLLLTGATGFIGKVLCDHLKEKAIPLTAAVRAGTSLPGINTVAVGNIGPDTDWHQALRGCDTVVHLAARAHVQDKSATALQVFRNVNVKGALTLAQQAANAGVKRFVFLSSIGVNGNHNIRPFTENDPPLLSGAYAISKWEAERALEKLAQESGMELVIIRSPLVYGAHVPGNFASLIFWSCQGIPLPFGAVHNQRSFIAIDNLVDFIALCADRERSPKAAGEIFLVSDGEDVSTTQVVRKIAAAYGKKCYLIPVPEKWLWRLAKLFGKSAKANRLLRSLTVDHAKAKNLLGWHPVIGMDAQLEKMAKSSR